MNPAGAVIVGAGVGAMNLPWQVKAWRFYGAPDGTAGFGVRLNQGANGEVRFVMGWVSQQVGRVGWHVDVDGVRLDDAKAKELMKQVSNEESTINITANLVVAGQLNYVAVAPAEVERVAGQTGWAQVAGPNLPGSDDKRWYVVSVIDPLRGEILKGEGGIAALNVPVIWPHPARPTQPDPPLRAVLDILEEIEQLQDLAYSQNRSRIAQMGILTVANELDLANTLPNGKGTDFASQLEEVINSPIVDPRRTSAAPIILRAPMEYMTGALSNGARGVQWTTPPREFDDTLEAKMRFAIQRLAWGFPVAPEILLGMTAANRAVAFQIEESTYRAYVEPIARLVGRAYARALELIWDAGKDEEGKPNKPPHIEVTPDATELLARRHSVADAKDLYDRGLVAAKFVRRVVGVDEEDAATPEDMERIERLRGKINGGGQAGPARENDPSEVAGNEPVRASGALAVEDLGRSLRGAIDMAHATAVSRIGASARTKLGRIPATPALELDPEAVPNKRLPSLLGPDRLSALNLNLNSAIAVASEQLEDWLQTQVFALMPDVWGSDLMSDAVETLRRDFAGWCSATACSWPLPACPPLLSETIMQILCPPATEGAEV